MFLLAQGVSGKEQESQTYLQKNGNKKIRN